MKLKILSLLAGVAFMVSCGPSYEITNPNTTVIDVPSGTITTFTTQYPTATHVVWLAYDPATVPIDWELTGWPVLTSNDYVVRFNMDNSDYYGYFDANGDWIGTAMVLMDYNTLPTAVTATISSEYPGYTISSVQKEFKKDNIAYEIQLKNGESKMKLLVDANGNILKRKTKSQ
jgi:hypothetical protein